MATAKPPTLGNASSFRRRLLRWYRKEQRKLPWRGETDPYRILVSEVMLQQTRVAVVLDRYPIFIGQFPTAEKLSRAKVDAVLGAWSGLGYYRRARSLYAAAKIIAAMGYFPRSASAISELPGVGRYTAAAVASIAFGEAVAVVDGNVKRVLQRLMGSQLSDAKCWEHANTLLDHAHPGDFNQAMMELGATICLPAQPRCVACPVAAICRWRGASTNRVRSPRRKAVLNYVLAIADGQVLLTQRSGTSSLMPGMWELPECGPQPSQSALLKLKHSITVTDFTVFVFNLDPPSTAEGKWVRFSALHRLPLTGLSRKILTRAALLNARTIRTATQSSDQHA